jgi:signal transduction histidine kinase
MSDRRTILDTPVFFILTSTILAMIVALVIIQLVMAPPPSDFQLLALFMGATALMTIGLAYTVQRFNLMSRFPTLRWLVPFTIILTSALIVFNVWVTARMMFISNHDFYLTTALLVFGSLIAIGFGVFITSQVTSRLRSLSDAAEVLAKGDFETRLDMQGSDEIAKLAATFNWMAESLGKLDQQQRQVDQTRRDLIAWVSHDLRTPLSTIRVMLEAIQDGIADDETTRRRYISNSLKEIEHLSRLINDLFELAQMDTGQLKLRLESVSLRDLISDTLSRMRAQADHQGVTLTAMLADDVDMIPMDSLKIQQVLYNLLDNALRYTPADGQVTLEARNENGDVRVDIRNTGANIDAEHLPYLFDRFYRVEKSRTTDKTGRRGTGLGLTIAESFVKAHNGRIWVESDEQHGTTFSFTLPRIILSDSTAND